MILGGGDGALLKELLSLEAPPQFVTMVDIDAAVMDACSKFMPAVCGKFLEEKEGKNFKVIAGDAFEHMEKLKVTFINSEKELVGVAVHAKACAYSFLGEGCGFDSPPRHE